MHRLAVGVVVVLCGCLNARTTTCDDGRVCPEDTVCKTFDSFAGTPLPRCVPIAAITKCDGKADHNDCGDGNRCYSGACLPGGCGNSLRDDGEVCDDGNQLAGDGCTNDCQSNETCGNGIADPIAGEACDDGNTFAHDGCSATCTPDVLAWSDPAVVPASRYGAMIAYDSDRDRVVMFSGYPNDPTAPTTNDLWEWDGRGWVRREVATGPHARFAGAMAYDSAHHATVLFGDDVSHDTWLWNGEGWTEQHPAVDPGPRFGAAMAYDPIGHQIVLFGGAASATLHDTWTWDGASWARLVVPDVVVGRRPSLGFDPRRGALVLVGYTDDAAATPQVWELDRNAPMAWKLVGAGGTAPAAAAAGDPQFAWSAPDQMLVYVAPQMPTWKGWNGSAWSDLAPPQAGVTSAQLVAAPSHDALFLFAGVGPTSATTTYVRDATKTWRTVQPTVAPTARLSACSAYDPIRRRMLVVGGRTGATRLGEVWAWNGGGWAQAPSGLPVRSACAATYDVGRDALVVFGGFVTGANLGDTYELDATGWHARTPGQAPTMRGGAAMAYDAANHEVVLFGGRAIDATGTIAYYGDTWTWDGTTWTQHVGVGPAARSNVGLAYDPVGARVVLFGGGDDTHSYDDTWIWDGTAHAWTEVSDAVHPPPASAPIAWDPARRVMVLFDIGTGRGNDVWELAGDTWTLLAAANPIAARNSAVMEQDPSGAGVVMFGGIGGDGTTLASLARLRWDGAPADTCAHSDGDHDGKIGCADDDCWYDCHPTCPPASTCDPGAPRCGDGTCDARFETCASCPLDCTTACVPICGDLQCTGTETAASCPGDCP